MLDIKLEETRVYQEAKTEGRVEGRTERLAEGLTAGLAAGLAEGKLNAQREILLMLLGQKAIKLSAKDRQKIEGLDADRLSELTKALLSFQNIRDLRQWLETN